MANEILTHEKIINDLKADLKYARSHLIISFIANILFSTVLAIIAYIFLTFKPTNTVSIILGVAFLLICAVDIFDVIRLITLYFYYAKFVKHNKYTVSKDKLTSNLDSKSFLIIFFKFIFSPFLIIFSNFN